MSERTPAYVPHWDAHWLWSQHSSTMCMVPSSTYRLLLQVNYSPGDVGATLANLPPVKILSKVAALCSSSPPSFLPLVDAVLLQQHTYELSS